MLPHDQKPRVTLEDLLHLKRAERPEPEFWARFERELREKQLTALLEKRPWWHGLGRVVMRHAYLPAGAAAALAVGLVTFRQHAPSLVVESPPDRGSAVADQALSPVRAVALPESHDAEQPKTASTGPAEPVVVIASTVPQDVAGMLPWSAPRVEETPSARSIAANLALLEQSEPGLLDATLGARMAQPARMQTVAARPDMELASITVNPPRGNNRLLAGYTGREFIPEPTAPDLVRERLARRLSDPDLLEQIRRLDLKADRVSLRL
jgi:hypothetical protein